MSRVASTLESPQTPTEQPVRRDHVADRASQREGGRLMKLAAAARWLGMGRSKVYSLVRAGRIPHLLIDGVIYFDVRELETWIDEHRVRVVPAASPRPVGRPRTTIDRAAECAALGIPVDHEFS